MVPRVAGGPGLGKPSVEASGRASRGRRPLRMRIAVCVAKFLPLPVFPSEPDSDVPTVPCRSESPPHPRSNAVGAGDRRVVPAYPPSLCEAWGHCLHPRCSETGSVPHAAGASRAGLSAQLPGSSSSEGAWISSERGVLSRGLRVRPGRQACRSSPGPAGADPGRGGGRGPAVGQGPELGHASGPAADP